MPPPADHPHPQSPGIAIPGNSPSKQNPIPHAGFGGTPTTRISPLLTTHSPLPTSPRGTPPPRIPSRPTPFKSPQHAPKSLAPSRPFRLRHSFGFRVSDFATNPLPPKPRRLQIFHKNIIPLLPPLDLPLLRLRLLQPLQLLHI